MNFLLKHKLLAATIVVIAAAIAWYFLSGSSSPEAVLMTEVPTVPAEAQQLIQSLAALRAVELDGAIFSNPAFRALRDFSTPITPEPVGRENPFAPLSTSEMGSSAAPRPAQVGVSSVSGE